MSIVIDGLVGSTGMEMKVDPGVPYVYAGFGGNDSALRPTLSVIPRIIIMSLSRTFNTLLH